MARVVKARRAERRVAARDNICERAIEKASLNRKNAHFYKTENGARVDDLFMSLIHLFVALRGLRPTCSRDHPGWVNAAVTSRREDVGLRPERMAR